MFRDADGKASKRSASRTRSNTGRGEGMKRAVYGAVVAAVMSSVWVLAQPAGEAPADAFRLVEVASVQRRSRPSQAAQSRQFLLLR